MATFARSLQVVKKQQYDSHDFFFVEKVEDFYCSLNDVEGIVFEILESELMIGHDPQS